MNGRENNPGDVVASLESKHIEKIARSIEAALIVGKVKTYIFGSENISDEDVLRWYKAECEMAARFLMGYRITDYVRFAKLVARCKLVTTYAIKSDCPGLSKRLITKFVMQDSPGCIRYIGTEA